MTDSDYIESLIQNRQNGIVVIPRRNLPDEPERDWWLIDRAILIPDQTVFVLQNCKIKLSDTCRDNFVRSANCGMGMGDPVPFHNIQIRGEGFCTLEGADHPRATGDAAQDLDCPCPKDYGNPDWSWNENRHIHSYGTDKGREGESQRGDWRNVGILLANVHNFRIENLYIVESHAWGISMEACSHGEVRNIDFSQRMTRIIDGAEQNVENQDGINLRNGCSDIIVSDITGHTGDDVIALTAAVPENPEDYGSYPGGALRRTEIMHNDFNRRTPGIRNVIIRNVKAYNAGDTLCSVIRLLPINSVIQNVIIDGLLDPSADDYHARTSILVGDYDASFGKCHPGSCRNFSISNVISNKKVAIHVLGYLKDSVISNVITRNPSGKTLEVFRENGLDNVLLSNIGKHGPEADLTTVDKGGSGYCWNR